jgi:hypothetical protein
MAREAGKGSKPRPFNVAKDDFDKSFENIFGKYVPPYLRNRAEETMQVRVKEDANEFGKCGCGRSPTGKCIGWHGLTEEEFAERKELYETGKVDLSGKEIK